MLQLRGSVVPSTPHEGRSAAGKSQTRGVRAVHCRCAGFHLTALPLRSNALTHFLLEHQQASHDFVVGARQVLQDRVMYVRKSWYVQTGHSVHKLWPSGSPVPLYVKAL